MVPAAVHSVPLTQAPLPRAQTPPPFTTPQAAPHSVHPPPALLLAEEQRYEQRFGCLEILCRPEVMPFEHFRASTDASGLPPARVLGVAAATFQGAAERAGAVLASQPLRALLREEQVGNGQGRPGTHVCWPMAGQAQLGWVLVCLGLGCWPGRLRYQESAYKHLQGLRNTQYLAIQYGAS